MTLSTPKRLQRFNRLEQRQPCSSWTKNYLPATKATRQEAPRVSKVRIFRGRIKLDRDLHTLSATESAAMLAALFESTVVDIHEQKVLQFDTSPNPMVNHPLLKGKRPLDLPGMYWAYENLDAEDLYPIIKQKDQGDLPDLFEGDLLLYINDSHGLYCVNWTAKRRIEQFEFSGLNHIEALETSKGKQKAFIRHAAEELYYQEAGIPTVRITEETFPATYIRNLGACYVERARLTKKLAPYVADAALLLNNISGTGDTGVDVGNYFCRKKKVTSAEWIVLFFASIWEKRVSVDLFAPLFIDRPISTTPPGSAPLASLFARTI